MCSFNFTFLSSLIEKIFTKEENNKAGCTLAFGGSVNNFILFSREYTIHVLIFH